MRNRPFATLLSSLLFVIGTAALAWVALTRVGVSLDSARADAWLSEAQALEHRDAAADRARRVRPGSPERVASTSADDATLDDVIPARNDAAVADAAGPGRATVHTSNADFLLETPRRTGDLLARIRVPRVGVSAVIREGIDDRTLRRAVGHVPETGWVGSQGNIALAGHRDTFFRPLRGIEKGDTIFIDTPAGSIEYAVDETRIVRADDVWVLDDTAAPALTLITCYPFTYVGSAPNRFIVRARPVVSAARDVSSGTVVRPAVTSPAPARVAVSAPRATARRMAPPSSSMSRGHGLRARSKVAPAARSRVAARAASHVTSRERADISTRTASRSLDVDRTATAASSSTAFGFSRARSAPAAVRDQGRARSHSGRVSNAHAVARKVESTRRAPRATPRKSTSILERLARPRYLGQQ